jgi:glucose-6-phosphate 1-dehydrogenase
MGDIPVEVALHIRAEHAEGPMLFIRGDEAEEAWRIIDPVMNAWTAGEVPMQEYPAGQAPPGPPS